jgi:hypothetical protein
MVRKRRGIDGLGGFLRSSQELLLLWDATYFTRLWCTFELAAFTYLHGPQARIRVFPSRRGYFIIMGNILFGFVFHAVQALGDHHYTTKGIGAIYSTRLQAVFSICFGTWFAHMARVYAREHRDMQKQITGFKCESAECFCCSVGHVIPGTAISIECDREAIYGAIRTWFPGGLDEFDAVVHEAMPAQVERNLGAFLFRFRDSIYLALPALWTALSSNAAVSCWDCWLGSIGTLARDMFTAWAYSALQMASMVWMASHAPTKRAHLDVAVSFIIAILWALLYSGQQFLFRYQDDLPWVFVLLVCSQAIVAKVLLSGVSCQRRHVNDRNHSGHAPARSQRARPTVELVTR